MSHKADDKALLKGALLLLTGSPTPGRWSGGVMSSWRSRKAHQERQGGFLHGDGIERVPPSSS